MSVRTHGGTINSLAYLIKGFMGLAESRGGACGEPEVSIGALR